MERYSNSRIQCYKSCKRLYLLKYIYGLLPTSKATPLETGGSYHKKVEQINKTGTFERDTNIKTNAMATVYKERMLPLLGNVVDAERWWQEYDSKGRILCGIIDAVRDDGTPIEFKTTSGAITGDYWASLENDEQILMYMSATGKEEIIYGVIRVPTIRQKESESSEEFEERCVKWFDDSCLQTNHIYREASRVHEFRKELEYVIDEIEQCKVFYRNPNNCYRWGRMCEYAPICNEKYDPLKKYVGFEVV